MPRVTHVKKAQQRYHTKPVLDDDGQPVKIALTRKDGTPKMTRAKRGRESRPVFITKTVADKTRPKPLLSCDYPGCVIDGGKIAVGTSYKWIKPKSGPYGGRLRARHAQHPSWNVWDYSSSLSAQVARIEHDADKAVQDAETEDDVTDALGEAADAIEELAANKREGAENIESGFGHPTEMSEQMAADAEALDDWAQEVRDTQPDPLADHPCDYCTDGEARCDTCGGDGVLDGVECNECEGSGEVTCAWCDGDGSDLEAARSAWADQVAEALSNCPV